MSSAAYIASHHILHLTLPLPLAYHGNPAREARERKEHLLPSPVLCTAISPSNFCRNDLLVNAQITRELLGAAHQMDLLLRGMRECANTSAVHAML